MFIKDTYKLRYFICRNVPLNFFLFELLFPYGFNGEQVESIIKSFDGISGKSFYSSTYELIKDRNYLIIIPKQKTKRFSLKISDKLSVVKLKDNSSLQIKSISRTKGFKIPQQLNIAALDKDKLHFPLEIRNWQKGNYFYPIGMKQKKKLSDFFVDNKFSKIEKEKALLLISKGEVVWVIGHRLDNRFKITDSTENVLILST